MARGNSSRASSEFSSVRARAYPGIWRKGTQDAIDENIRRDGETFESEAYFAEQAVKSIANTLKDDLPGHTYLYSDVKETDDKYYPFKLVATFRSPNGKSDTRTIASFDTPAKAAAIRDHLSEGMDIEESGRSIDLRRLKTKEENEESKELDKRELTRRQEKEEAVADKRESQRNYAAFVQKVKDDMEKERKARINK